MSRSTQYIASREVPTLSYRELEFLNQSMLKLFDKDPVEFVKQFKLGYKKKQRSTPALVIGDIVDFYILDCNGEEVVFDHTHDKKFVLLSENRGTSQAFILADALFEITKECVTEDGKVTCSFEDRFKQAFMKVQEDGKYRGKTEEQALVDFNEKAYNYYKKLVDNLGKIMVDASILEKSKKVAHILLEDEFTKDIFIKTNASIENLPKFPITFEISINGVMTTCKAEIDYLQINHLTKDIYPRDIKTAYNNEKFLESYLDFGYYIQAAFYHLAVEQWAVKNGMDGYAIHPMEFVVGDTSSANRRPIRYQLKNEDIEAGLWGFNFSGKSYKGVWQLVKEIEWAEATDNWNVGKEVYDNNGKLNLNLKYE